MDRGAWWAKVHGLANSQTQLHSTEHDTQQLTYTQQALTGVRLLPFHRDGGIRMLSFLMITFKKIVLGSTRKTFLVYKTG